MLMKKKISRCNFITFVLSLSLVILSVCGKNTSESGDKSKMNIQKEDFGKTPDGVEVELYTLTNDNGLRAKITNFGAILVSLEIPGKNGKNDDITLGFDNIDGYCGDNPYFGATVGRYGNRIAGGKFTLNGIEYNLVKNNGENHLHGGIKGFNKVIWKGEEIQDDEGVGVKLIYLSADGEEGYPGNLTVTVIYTLTNMDELKISYEAETDKPTIINLTHHSYFNLSGDGSGDILKHELLINADRYLPVDEGLIPTGEMRSVKGTPMDFTSPMEIGARIENVEGGYDHCYVLNTGSEPLTLAARVSEPGSGRVMEIYTTEPGIQFYTGNFLNGTVRGKGGNVYHKHYGFCLETQHFPDSPNKPEFPSTVLMSGEKYSEITVHKFYIE